MAVIRVCDICGKELQRHLFAIGYQPVVPRYEIREIGHLNKSKVLDLCAGCEKSMVAWVKANKGSEGDEE